ncbi:hypothetical protein B2J88_08090 [Rhodococcus sp. SRB_17]|nr:hypothetical protein [Rhodococcus sp. SRB_17]
MEGAEFTHDDQQNVGQAGVHWVARNDQPNIVGLVAKVGPVPVGSDAIALAKMWRHSLGRGKQIGTFHAITESGGDKFQAVRLSGKLEKLNLTMLKDIGLLLEDPVALRSDETWWRKRPVVKKFTAAQFATASIDTESDEPVWPHIVITGPITLPKIGWQGELVPLPTIAAGDKWTIETDPDWFEITDASGADRSWVGRRWYKKIPAGIQSVPITIQGTGTTSATSVEVTVPQLFWEGI